MKVLIDNGHGITTKGKGAPYSLSGAYPALELKEWSWARSIAAIVVLELRKRGVDAELLVPEQADISLTERCRRANNLCKVLGAKNVLLVSIHGNALGNGDQWNSARGWSAYTSKGQTQGDKLATCLYKYADRVFAGMKVRKDMKDGDPDFEENFTILSGTNCAACLTENFFYTNVEDCKYMLSRKGMMDIAHVHVEGILEYIHTTAKK